MKRLNVYQFHNEGPAGEVSAVKEEVLNILNDVENRPEEYKGVTDNFVFLDFNFNRKNHGNEDLFSFAVVRTEEAPTELGRQFLFAVLKPTADNTNFRDVVRINRYRGPKGNRKEALAEVFALLPDLVNNKDEGTRRHKVATITAHLERLLK